jgi:hypothetical protein
MHPNSSPDSSPKINTMLKIVTIITMSQPDTCFSVSSSPSFLSKLQRLTSGEASGEDNRLETLHLIGDLVYVVCKDVSTQHVRRWAGVNAPCERDLREVDDDRYRKRTVAVVSGIAEIKMNKLEFHYQNWSVSACSRKLNAMLGSHKSKAR